MAGLQGENLEAYKDFTDLEVVLANASRCQLVSVISNTVITCDLPPSIDENLLNDDGDAIVQVTNRSLYLDSFVVQMIYYFSVSA